MNEKRLKYADWELMGLPPQLAKKLAYEHLHIDYLRLKRVAIKAALDEMMKAYSYAELIEFELIPLMDQRKKAIEVCEQQIKELSGANDG